ncbi:MAG TPA: hypothetical protein VH021_20115 [Trebonia sp.]|jgi:hypothetical protein|nr:hypothetical protein [Trebonia sp.]
MRADGKLSRARQASRGIRAARPSPVDGTLRHCRHCLGDHCPGDCLLADGQCIHGWNGKHPGTVHWQLLLTRRFWHRVLWGRP